MTVAERQTHFEYEGEQRLIPEAAICELLERDVLFVFEGDNGEIQLAVNCNDLFYWATADAEDLPYSEIGTLLAMVRESANGADRWCCRRRKMRPQTPIEKRWREEGLWTDELESFPARDPKDCG